MILLSLTTGCLKKENKVVIPFDLAGHIDKSLTIGGASLSVGETFMIKSMLMDIANQIFTTDEHKQYWIALVGVESGYDNRAKSAVGATGLGQLMPKYYSDLVKTCGLGDLPADSINDRYINSYVSACHFKHLIDKSGGVVSLALVAYNAGAYSPSYKSAKTGGAVVAETANYVSKINLRKEILDAK
jgi:hypothetical protein